eukprot:364616-Chlamydomonas_euryale.AAC.4
MDQVRCVRVVGSMLAAQGDSRVVWILMSHFQVLPVVLQPFWRSPQRGRSGGCCAAMPATLPGQERMSHFPVKSACHSTDPTVSDASPSDCHL